MELSVGELAHVLRQSQPRVSRHVKILADAGLLQRHREGAWVYLRLGASERVDPILAALDAWDQDAPSTAADITQLSTIRSERVAVVEAYFTSHAEKWDRIRSMHVGEAKVEAAMLRALGSRPLGRLLDVGTGVGHVLELLGPRATRAVGIDLSSEMLRIARARLDQAGLVHCQVRQADMCALPHEDASFDTVVLHQVLHYTHEPARALAECVRVLAPGGRLLVVDVAPHSRDELRTDYAHARLGFADAQIIDWLNSAGLDARVTDHLEGKELTVTLWLGERADEARCQAA